MARPSTKHSPTWERYHVLNLLAKYGWLCSQPTATPEDRRFLARLRGRLGELTTLREGQGC